jgi:hypothetical protein
MEVYLHIRDVGGGIRELKDRARDIWSRTRLHVWPESYVLASLSRAHLADAAALVATAAGFAALVVERDEVSVTVAELCWAESRLARAGRAEGPFRALTLDIDIQLDVCGYLAPAATLLAEAGVAIVPQCGFLKDHILVRREDLEPAVRVLDGWIAACRE